MGILPAWAPPVPDIRGPGANADLLPPPALPLLRSSRCCRAASSRDALPRAIGGGLQGNRLPPEGGMRLACRNTTPSLDPPDYSSRPASSARDGPTRYLRTAARWRAQGAHRNTGWHDHWHGSSWQGLESERHGVCDWSIGYVVAIAAAPLAPDSRPRSSQGHFLNGI